MSIESSHLRNSPEKIPSSIEGKKIDIEKFKGFLVWTQVPNIASIMKSGLQIPSKRKEVRWKYGGRLSERWQNSPGTYLTIYDSDVHSFANGKYPWPKAGQVGILIDKSLDDALGRELDEELHKPSGEVDKDTIEAVHEGAISPELIRALVMNKYHIALENPRDTITKTLPTFEGDKMRITTYEEPQSFNFTQENYKQMLETRLDRLTQTDAAKNLVPLYDSSGSIIWPINRTVT